MKTFFLLFLTALPGSAQIYADVSTTLGDFTIELYHEEAPKAVANFVTLAEGTRPWIDSTTGEIKRNTPYYDGIIFHRVIDNFMNQAGSQDGTGADGPGYVYPDEVDNGLLHDVPYLLSAANSGPHTNGSQFFTTVVPTPWLDGIHTVFGKVVSGTDTIDTINDTEVVDTVPTTPVVIESMTIRREGAEALAFDEFAQGLPEVREIEMTLKGPRDGDPARLLLEQPGGTTLKVVTSPDLQAWTPSERYLGRDSDPLDDFQTAGNLPRAFYRSNLVEWPGEAAFPDSLAGKTVTMTASRPSNEGPIEVGVLTLALTDPGSFSLLQPNGNTISGSVDFERSSVVCDAYGAQLLIFSEAGGLVPVRLRLGADLPMVAPLTGRITGTIFTNPNPTSVSGTFTVED